MGQNYEVVVIGGGVVGAATAYYLAKRRIKTALVERNDICSGTSGACDKAVSMQSKSPGLSLALALRSREMFQTLGEELESDIQFEPCGGMIAIQNEDQLAVVKAFIARQRGSGLAVELLDAAAARRMQPVLSPGIVAATHCPLDARVNPLKTTFAYARAAKRYGADIITGVEAAGIIIKNGSISGVQTAHGVFGTETVVNAAGVWAPFIGQMVGIPIPIKPRRGQLIVTEAVPGLLNGELWSARYMVAKHNPELIRREDPLAAELGIGLSVSQTAEGNLLIGGTREFAGYCAETTLEAMASVLRHAADVLPVLKKTNIIRTFAGLRPYTPDGKPILGPVSQVDGFVMAAGHEGDGIALAPVTGSIIADFIATGNWVSK